MHHSPASHTNTQSNTLQCRKEYIEVALLLTPRLFYTSSYLSNLIHDLPSAISGRSVCLSAFVQFKARYLSMQVMTVAC